MHTTIAVTGATGFLGSHLVTLLRSQHRGVRAIVRPTSCTEHLKSLGVECRVAALDDPAALAAALEGCDVLIHVAGAVAFHGDWRHFQSVNVDGTANILAAAGRAGVRRSVYVSSTVAVGASLAPRILDESADWNLDLLKVPYVTTKRRAEEVALGFGNVVVVNPSCVVGPDDFGSEFGTLCQRFWRGRVPIFFGGGQNFVDVRDVATGIVLAAERGRAGQRYLLAGANLTFDALFTELSRAAGRSIPRLRLPAMVGRWFAASEALVRKGGRRPNLSPDQAKLMSYYFFFSAAKAERELGFRARPIGETMRDAYHSWRASRKAA